MQENDLKKEMNLGEDSEIQTAQEETPELPDQSLSDELAKAQAKASENYDLYVRAVAEAENVRRRSAEDVAKARKFGIEKFAEAMLPVVDSMEKALEASANESGPLKEGLEITYRQLLSALEHNGMKCENPVGLKFDPNSMQAITMVKDRRSSRMCRSGIPARLENCRSGSSSGNGCGSSVAGPCFFKNRLNIHT